MAKEFPIGDILSVTTGYIELSERRMDGVYNIMAYLAGKDSIAPMEAVRYREQAIESIHRDLPWTKDIQFTPALEGSSQAEKDQHTLNFLTGVETKYGKYHSIGQISRQPARHTRALGL